MNCNTSYRKDVDKESAQPNDMRASYSRFVTTHYSPSALLCVIASFVVYHFFEYSGVCGHVPVILPALQWTTLAMSWVAFGCLCMIWYLKIDGDRVLPVEIVSRLQPILPDIQAIHPILVSIAHSVVALHLLYSRVDGNCVQLNLATSALKIYPLLAYFLLRDTRHPPIAFSWTLGVITCFWCAVYLHRPERICEQLTYTIGTGLVLRDSYRQDQNIFRLVRELQATLKSNEQLAVAAQALELRAMIGNVAHDMKTVRGIRLYCAH